MRFVDEASILASAGDGGAGCVSFHREKYRPRGAPDGGDGGRGGSVVLVADEREFSLADFRHTREWAASNGGRGGKDKRSGADGADLSLRVPVGTIVFHEETGEILGDMSHPGKKLTVALGGSGGVGNHTFKSGVDRGTRKTIPGSPGEQTPLRLEVLLLADVGLFGAPNSGKSALLRAVSGAKPQVADYPFTTKDPGLGMVCLKDAAGFETVRFVIVDTPGLIKGSSAGAGLGTRCLRHLRRARLLLHVIDASVDTGRVLEDVRVVREEMVSAEPSLADRAVWLVLNKADLATPDKIRELSSALTAIRNEPVYVVCSLDGNGCQRLCRHISDFLSQTPAARRVAGR